MATQKSGPVKPPVLDLKAKSSAAKASASSKTPQKPAGDKAEGASGSAPASSGKSRAGATTPPPAAASPSSPRSSNKRPLIAALVGALVALIISLALAVSGVFQPFISSGNDEKFIALRERVGANLEQINQARTDFASLGDKVDALNERVIAFDTTLNQQTKQLSGKIDDLNQKIDKVAALSTELKNNVAALPTLPDSTFDPGPLEEKITLLGARIDAVAAGASAGDAQKLSADLGAIRNQFAGQRQEVAALKAQLDGIRQPLGGLNGQLDIVRQALAQNQLQIGQNAKAIAELDTKLAAFAPAAANDSQNIVNKALQLPLALSGMQNALETGRPFAVELASLEAVLPELKIAKNLREIAKTGLLRPDQLATRFQRKIPLMLAARPPSAESSIQQALLDRLKSLVALRPSEAAGLSGIDALVAAAEGAASRRDFSSAGAAIAQMPAEMQAALGELGRQIVNMGAMQTLLNEARTTALSQGLKTGADL